MDERPSAARESSTLRFFCESLDLMGVASFGGHFLQVNPACQRSLGWPADELLRRPFMDIVHIEDRDAVASFVAGLQREREADGLEVRLRHRDGGFRTFAIRARADEDEELFHFLGTDITARRRAEEHHRQAAAIVALHATVLERVADHEPLLDVLDALVRGVEALSDGMLASILIPDAAGRCLRHCTAPSLPDSYSEAVDGVPIGPTGGSCGTAAFRRQRVIAADIDRDPLWIDYRDAAAEHGLRSCWSTPILTADGELLGTFALYYRQPRTPDARHFALLDAAGHLARVAFEHDITARGLQDHRQRLGKLISQAPIGVFETDTHGNVTFVNDQMLQIGGWKPADLNGNAWRDRLYPEDHAALTQSWQLALDCRSTWSTELRLLHTDGGLRTVVAVCTPLLDGDGTLTGFLGCVTDLTDRREAEARQRVFEREHDVAKALQHALLPGRLPEVHAIRTAARYIAGAAGMDVGGDWYDLFELPGGDVAFALGDVVGRGAAAAVTMGQLRATLRAVARSTASPADVLARLQELTDEHSFMSTLIYGVICADRRSAEYACAGHPFPLLVTPKPRFLDGGRNAPLGMINTPTTSAHIDLQQGGRLLLYTDGLIERRQSTMVADQQRLLGAAALLDGDLDGFCDRLIADLGADAAGDDVAVLAIDVMPDAR